MPIFIIAGIFGLAGLAIGLRFIPPPHAITLIRIRKGTVQVSRGHLRAPVKADLQDILHSAGIARGFIAITPGNRVTFSRNITPEIHQRLRNVLLNS